MKHATDEVLDGLESLLIELRSLPGLIERKRGVFYWKSRAFLHFHEHEGIAYADVRLTDGDFTRLAVGTATARKHLVSAIRQRVAETPSRAADARPRTRDNNE